MDELERFARTETARRLRGACAHDRLAHALLLCGGAERLIAARYAAAAMECTAPEGKPCLRCEACRKVRGALHPDIVTVCDPEHRELSVDVVRAVRADAFVTPNEGARKVFIFEDASLLNTKDQNTLLKVVEEGPPYAAFLFCAEQSGVLLPTLRSRCTELRFPEGDAASESDDGRAEALTRALLGCDRAEGVAALFRLEQGKPERDALAQLFSAVRVRIAGELTARYTAPASAGARQERVRLLRMTELLEKYRRLCTNNVGVGPLLGGLAAEWEELL